MTAGMVRYLDREQHAAYRGAKGDCYARSARSSDDFSHFP